MISVGSNNVKHLRKLNPEELREFLNSFDVILCDCDGVIWLPLGHIPKAGEALQLLKDMGKQVEFVSNNSIRPDAEFLQKFKEIGIKDVVENDVVHPVKTMAWYLKKYKPNCTVYPLIALPGIEILGNNGIDTVPIDVDTYSLNCVSVAKYLLQNGPEKVNAVLADMNCFTSFTHLSKALLYLKEANCDLILGGMDTIIPMGETIHVPGFTYIYDILIKYSKKDPVILGKPSPWTAEFLKERYAITNPKRCLFIGDSLRQDIGFAKSSGFQSLFVLTGGHTKEDMLNVSEDQRPDYYTETLADFIDLLKDIKV